jgi:predicted transglutaminase-like cysteine proteinase
LHDPVYQTAAPASLARWATNLLLCLLVLCVPAAPEAGLRDFARLETLATAGYGPEAAQRIRNWQQLMVLASAQDERQQIHMVNEFFNRNVLYASDPDLWNVPDHWATPLETLGKAAGDCEDYAIAKYTSLRKLGIPDSRLRIFYVHARLGALTSNAEEAHMVLGYYPSEDAEPLILDNLITDIRLASQRNDLTPIFSFNSEGLWVDGSTVSAGDSTARLSNWRGALERMRADGINLNRPIAAGE